MPVPALIRRRDADALEARLPAATRAALCALQRALLALVHRSDDARPGLVDRLLTSETTPRSPDAWHEALQRALVGHPPAAAALVLAAGRRNPALAEHAPLLDPPALAAALDRLLDRALHTADGPAHMPLGQALLAPAAAHPHDLQAQLAWVSRAWGALLPDDVRDGLLRAGDVFREATTFRGFGGPGPVEVADFGGGGPPGPPPGLAADDPGVRFSRDRSWMKGLVMMAKHTYVWLDQLSRRTGRRLHRLDQVPDSALADLAAAGVTGLWLIGVWERSPASRDVKRRMGNPDALASAYSVWDYVVADSLGGRAAMDLLQHRAGRHGIRVGADMVPNHTAIDGRWVIEHPDRFIQTDAPPFPAYRFTGPDLSQDGRVRLHLEDGYDTQTDAAVVFRREDAETGRVRYLYHGNDGTVMPWNDTAQLDFSRAETREAVLSTLVGLAQQFPILRLDAAMTLARRHVQRLWFPPPGQGGAIPSRAERGLSQGAFDAAMPREFWVEAVERVAAEAPDTLLLAEAFWMMEAYFVRTLGMHRVYHSAFMHMLRDGDNGGLRQILKDLLAYSPEVLERYANFLSNPDEETAAQQFGTMERYFTAATLQATLPGLPMLGHGQLEGSREKYGMEAARAHDEESVDAGLLAHHETMIFPLLRQRARFSGTDGFHLFDHVAPDGSVNEDVYAFSNRAPDGRVSLVLVNHGGALARGRVCDGAPRNEGTIDAPDLQTRSLAQALGMRPDDGVYYGIFEQRASEWRLLRGADLARHGLAFDLGPWESRVFTDVVERVDHDGAVAARCAALGGRPTPALDLDPAPAPRALPHRPTDPARAAPGGLAPAVIPRGAGVLLHPSSLPGPEGIGTLGGPARDLVRWLRESGAGYWQVLPLCEGGPGDSPYSSPSSLVGSPWLLDLADLATDGLLSEREAARAHAAHGPVEFESVRATKGPLLRLAARRLLDQPDHPLHAALQQWRARHAWADDAALFGELRDAHGGAPWWEWPADLRDRAPAALDAAAEAHAGGVAERAALAFLFDHQWDRLRAVADRARVRIVGDLPIYVSRDSSDVWVDRDLFEFGTGGEPARVAGVPPDAFSDTGQLWGNPLYDWDRMAADGFAWWMRRLRRCLSWTPVLRIDHFRAFSAYWAVPADAPTAMDGVWVTGPGLAFFEAAREALGPQWFIAEDLGQIDAPVHLLREQAGLLGTRVAQFGFAGGRDNLHLPWNVGDDVVLYTGTHDNDTTAGWWAQASAFERAHLRQMLPVSDTPAALQLALACLQSRAQLVVLPAQDLMGLGTEARMNVPGVGEGNWAWRLAPGALDPAVAARLRGWLTSTDRLG